MKTGDLLIADDSGISTSTFHNGSAGNITLSTKSITMQTGASVLGVSLGAGKAGSLNLSATETLLISGQGTGVSTSALNSGAAGSIELKATKLDLNEGAIISAASFDTGGGGSIIVSAQTSVVLSNNASISTASSSFAKGGNINITSGKTINMFDSTITGQAGIDGGQINLGSTFVILDRSTINGLAGGQPVFISIDPTAIFLSSESQILTTAQSVPLDFDLTGSLVQLSENFVDDISQLSEACTIKLEGEFSSFIVVGRGGMPVDPSSAQPGFHITQKRDTKKRREH